MKVIHVETGMNLYGGALQVFYLLRGLQAAGVENILVCPRGSGIAAVASPYADVRELTCRGELDAVFGHRLFRLVCAERADILHVHSRRGADLWGSLVVRRSGQTALLTRRVDNPEPGWLARWKYRPFRRIVTISEGIRQVLLGEGLADGSIECIHSAVDAEAYRREPDPAWFRREFGLPDDAAAVGVIAQLIERKGHRFLIEAAPGILKQCPNVYFLFFGKGPEHEQLEGLCRQAGIAERFRFAGFRDDMPAILPNLQLVAHPALMEGLGIALLQASAAGIPIVAARSGGIPEIVDDGVNGRLVAAGQAGELCGAIVDLLNSPAKRIEMGGKGKRLVEENFSIAAMVRGNLRIYRDILTGT